MMDCPVCKLTMKRNGRDHADRNGNLFSYVHCYNCNQSYEIESDGRFGDVINIEEI